MRVSRRLLIPVFLVVAFWAISASPAAAQWYGFGCPGWGYSGCGFCRPPPLGLGPGYPGLIPPCPNPPVCACGAVYGFPGTLWRTPVSVFIIRPRFYHPHRWKHQRNHERDRGDLPDPNPPPDDLVISGDGVRVQTSKSDTRPTHCVQGRPADRGGRKYRPAELPLIIH